MTSSITIAKGDDLDAFGQSPITIEVTAETAEYLQQFLDDLAKIVIIVDDIYKEYNDPVFPLSYNLTAAETSRLKESNKCFLVAFDKLGKRKTLKGCLTITTTPDVMKSRNGYVSIN